MNKQAMINALRAFINQRSGIDVRNYQSGDWKQSRECFLGDYRPILRHGRHARTLLRAVELRDSITAEHILEASRSAYSGRLQFVESEPKAIGPDSTGREMFEYKVRCEYTTGQYFPTEYRKAACAVLASVLWHYWSPDCKTGEEIRKQARSEFGPAIARTWFN